MGELSTLEGFKLDLITDELNFPEGFAVRAKSCENMILIIIDDLREHPNFKGDRSVEGWPDILQSLSRIGLDPAKAVVSLGCRSEAIRAGGKTTFNIGVVQFGWACATAHDPTRDRVLGHARARARALVPPPALAPDFAQERVHLLHQVRG